MLGMNPSLQKLMLAVQIENTDKIKSLIEANPSFIDIVMPNSGKPLLTIAIEMNNEELVKFILDKMTAEQLNNILYNEYQTIKVRSSVNAPIMQAIELGNLEIVQAIINKDPSALNRRQKYGSLMGSPPLTLAANLDNENMVELLLQNGADVNLPHLAGVTAYSIAKENKNQRIIDLLEQHGANPSVAQAVLLDQFATWLELKASAESESISDVQYDKTYIEMLAKDLRKNGHCSGFSWMHRIMKDKKQDELFARYMQNIAKWDKTAESLANDPFLDRTFNELLQVTIYAQQAESLELVKTDSDAKDTQEVLLVNQNSAEIARMISANESANLFSHYVQFDEDNYLTTRTSAEVKEYIDKCYEMNATTYTSNLGHAIDMGKSYINGQEMYWIYNSNHDCGTIYFNSFEEFYLSLKFSLLNVRSRELFANQILGDTIPIALSSYMKPLEYRYDILPENTKHPDQRFEDFLQQKMSNDFYTLILLDDEKIDGLYIEFKKNIFHFNNREYNSLPELLIAVETFCGKDINDEIEGAYDVKKSPPPLSEEVMIKMFIGAIRVNDLELATRLRALISDEVNLDNKIEALGVNAAKIGDTVTLRAVLSMKPELVHLSNINLIPKGESLISLAVQSKNIACVEEILKHDPDLINYVITDGYYKGHNLLTSAIKQMSSSKKMIEHLAKNYPKLAEHSITMGMDVTFGPLISAIRDGSVEKVQILLKCVPALVNEGIKSGYRMNMSALIFAVQNEKNDIVKVLVDHGADLNFEYKGKRAIDYAKSEKVRQILGNRPSTVIFQNSTNTAAESSLSSLAASPEQTTKPASEASSSGPPASKLKKPTT